MNESVFYLFILLSIKATIMGTFRQFDIDQALLGALQAGDPSALDTLFKKHGRKMRYFAKSIVKTNEVAEEIMVDSIVKLWQNRARFESSESINAFLYVVIKNLSINYVKSAYASQQFEYEFDENLENIDPDTYIKIIRAEFLQSIHDEVTKLPEKQQAVFRMTYFEDLTTEEICERLKMSPAAVFTNRSRALEQLRLVFRDRDMWVSILTLHMFLATYREQLCIVDSLFHSS
ncbi:RNA polymerase sigma factor [Sphingobacterium chuzhouense]|uniref:Sigma-70 family RNA polymerase sigma factor n=1 Tax=Sphingobacterium chuzhouense TaxID=1742264 RepID=A0ABR7XXF9_9SPHI|nr:sigma-70 family RNA polymerase sigma factor [Sphingobacterium chuzhouense]MBD1423730.1 sigma-70 family RNA polymerase sigma factor [Sphingobacterium chuzhouense]